MALADEPIAGGRHKVFGHPDAGGHPADLDHRVAPAACRRARRRPAPGDRARGRDAVARRRRRRVLVRRRLGQPLDADRRDQHRAQHRLPRAAGADRCSSARTTACGISVPHAGRLGRARVRLPARAWTTSPSTASIRSRPGRTIALGRRARARERRRPVFLHLRTVRFLGHAGSDAEISYRTPTRDRGRLRPRSAARHRPALLAAGLGVADELLERYDADGATRRRGGTGCARRSAGDVRSRGDGAARPRGAAARVAARAAARARQRTATSDTRQTALRQTLAEGDQRRRLAEILRTARSAGAGLRRGRRRQGRRLRRRPAGWPAGSAPARVFDTLLDEQSILGLALGGGLAGLLPVPEIQYLAYLHNAEDQLRGEAATLPFFSSGRLPKSDGASGSPGLAYQQGFGGHFHNDNALGVLRDIPGLVRGLPGPGRRRRRHAAHLLGRRRRRRHGERCSSSRSRCTTPATCTSPTTAAG